MNNSFEHVSVRDKILYFESLISGSQDRYINKHQSAPVKLKVQVLDSKQTKNELNTSQRTSGEIINYININRTKNSKQIKSTIQLCKSIYNFQSIQVLCTLFSSYILR